MYRYWTAVKSNQIQDQTQTAPVPKKARLFQTPINVFFFRGGVLQNYFNYELELIPEFCFDWAGHIAHQGLALVEQGQEKLQQLSKG
jgi:hypothetical protein